MSQPKNKAKYVLILAIASIISVSALGLIRAISSKPNVAIPSEQKSKQALQTSSITIGILTSPDDYSELANYLRSQFGNKVQVTIDGSGSISYSDVKDRLFRKEWDVTFALSPMLSVAAKENGYTFAARMFADKPSYYQAALFVKSNSPIQSFSDLKPTTTIALGDFNSASSFYMPTYDLFGKTLQVDMKHRSQEIRKMVKQGKADVGAAAYDVVKNDPDFQVIHLSRPIPGSNVYLSPNLSESDRQAIAQILSAAPESIKKQANYGAGQEPDYSEFLKISRKAEEVLKCADFHRNPVKFFCPNSNLTQSSYGLDNTPDIVNPVNEWSRKNGNAEQLSRSGQDSYQVKQVDDGDTIVVNNPAGEEIRVRFACIDTAEVPHTAKEQNSTAVADTNQFLWGDKARKRLYELIKQGGDRVALAIVDTDRYGRKVAEVRLPNGTLTQEVLVREGLAMIYRKYINNCPSAAVVEQAEVQAKQQQLNIWADPQFTPPWEWRHSKKS